MIITCLNSLWSMLQEWRDVDLSWNKSEFEGIAQLSLPNHKVWKPDILLMNRYRYLTVNILLLLASLFK